MFTRLIRLPRAATAIPAASATAKFQPRIQIRRASLSPASAVTAPLRSFELLFRNNSQVVKAADRPDALLVLTIPLAGKAELTMRRDHACGEKLETAHLHDFTTVEADMTLRGSHERRKEKNGSFTGLAHPY
ncbi:hypothetical protein F5B18DRAFT_488848 [Nemania serpens]|nr:hypothetical protein F5B18DRAFT_488848 [Nemania serpens]